MALALSKKRTVKWPVTVRIPLDGGRYRDEKFTAVFEILPQDVVDAMPVHTLDHQLLERCLVGWEEVEDPETKEQIPFGEDAKAVAIQDPCIRKALIEAYGEAVKGRKGKS